MEIRNILQLHIEHALRELGIEPAPFVLEHPADMSHGDYACNVAMVLAKKIGENPRTLAEKIANTLQELAIDEVESVAVAGPGFVNITLARNFFTQSLQNIIEVGPRYGSNEKLAGKKVMVEYTDPNPFKQFHIGHLMTNAIGESLARIYDAHGATVVRANYQGDVGMHVAKAIYGIKALGTLPSEDEPLAERTRFLGQAYVMGSKAYEEDEQAKESIHAINKAVYEKNDAEVNALYDQGRAWSLEHFEKLYVMLGTTFDHYFFEGEVWQDGVALVTEYLAKGIFEMSDGAIVYKGEQDGLHTRVFINGQGLPTYEAKDLGLIKQKLEREPDIDTSIIITGSEQKEYMKVLTAAAKHIWPDKAGAWHHITHGMMTSPGGKKMSSRKGDVITGESLLLEVQEVAKEKITQAGKVAEISDELLEQISVAAIKYMILKQDSTKNIIFDLEQALSFEGDSGPYLQYTYARAQSALAKGRGEGLVPSFENVPEDITNLERLLYRFSEVVQLALSEHAPHHITQYSIELAREFNSFYGNTKLVDTTSEFSPYRLAMATATAIIIHNGLHLLGIQAPEKM
jgi:arginyl-tRNA synthetase